MRDETDQAVTGEYPFNLFSPQRRGILRQDVKQRIVLNRRERELKDSAHEVRHHRAAPASLRLQMGDVRDRHIIRELERVIPLLFAVHRARPEASTAEL